MDYRMTSMYEYGHGVRCQVVCGRYFVLPSITSKHRIPNWRSSLDMHQNVGGAFRSSISMSPILSLRTTSYKQGHLLYYTSLPIIKTLFDCARSLSLRYSTWAQNHRYWRRSTSAVPMSWNAWSFNTIESTRLILCMSSVYSLDGQKFAGSIYEILLLHA